MARPRRTRQGGSSGAEQQGSQLQSSTAPEQAPVGTPGKAERFDRFSARARQAFALAEDEARRLNHPAIGPEHLLLALLRMEQGGQPKRLVDDLEQLRAAVEKWLVPGATPPSGPLELTPECKRAIELAVDEAKRLRHSQIDPEHLLLGIVREGNSLDQPILNTLAAVSLREGLIAARLSRFQSGLRPTVFARPVEEPPPVPVSMASATRDNVLSIRVSDADLAAVDSLVEVGIMKSRSEAAAWLLSSGVATNRALFDKARGIVEEVRRLREEAQQLVREHTASPAE